METECGLRSAGEGRAVAAAAAAEGRLVAGRRGASVGCSSAGLDCTARVRDDVARGVGSRGLWRRGIEAEVGVAAAAAVTVWEMPMGGERLTVVERLMVEESTVAAEAGGRSKILGNIPALPFFFEWFRVLGLRLLVLFDVVRG